VNDRAPPQAPRSGARSEPKASEGTSSSRGRPARSPRRIVSLVPSLTESLFELGLGERVVGVTDWCVHPAERVAGLPKVGGTKNPDVAAILALAPDLVIANQEENRRRDVEKLEAAGVHVWVTYPRTVAEGAAVLAELAELGAASEARERVVAPVLAAVEEAQRARPELGVAVFCPIWRDPWMAVGGDTYAHDLLALCGGRNVFAERGDRRYPRVTLDEVVAAAPEVVILPDEPYAFDASDVVELRRLALPAAQSGRIHLIDGTWVSWYGSRIARAIRALRSLLAG
jgi:ABC-type Fe3+-hydroxamate transport system substrate-binding protein